MSSPSVESSFALSLIYYIYPKSSKTEIERESKLGHICTTRRKEDRPNLGAMSNALFSFCCAVHAVMPFKSSAVATESPLQILVAIAVALAVEEIELVQATLSIQQRTITFPFVKMAR